MPSKFRFSLALSLALFSLAALAAIAMSASASGAAKACADGPISVLQSGVNDLDYDGFNDSFWLEAEYAPAPPEQAWMNVTVFGPSGPVVATNISSHSTDDLNYTHERFDFVLRNATDPSGTYRANATVDYTNGSCTWYDYFFEIYPPGVYQPAISGSNLSQMADQNSTVTFTLNLTNAGNNPDTFSFYALKSLLWTVTIEPPSPTLDGGASVTVNVSVVIPLNAAPLSVDSLNITVSSSRVPARVAFINLTATVNAQVFAFSLTADNTTQAGLTGNVLTFGFHATNLGNNRDTIPVSLPAAPSSWAAVTTVTTLTLNAGEAVDFQVAVHLPFSYSYGAWWNFSVTLTSADGVTNHSIDLHARLLFPDFVIGPAAIVVSDPSPLVGANVSVRITVTNVGAPIQVTFAVSLNDGVTNRTAFGDMNLAGSVTFSFNWTAILGSTRLQAYADSTNSVPEENETNNQGTLSVTGVAPPPSNQPPLAVAASATAAGRPGEPVVISAGGSSDPDGTVVAYLFVFGDGTDSGWVTQSSVSHTYNASGNYTVTIRVRDDAGSESAPASEAVSIAPAGSSGGPGGGGGGGGGGGTGGGAPVGSGDSTLLILVAVLVAGLAAAAVLWRKRGQTGPPGAPPAAPPPSP